MITRPLNPRQRMYLSLVMNFMTRVPSIAVIFIFLPALRAGLGVDGYGQLLTSLAAGSVLAIPFGGFGQMTTRLIGTASSIDDRVDEARAFNSSVLVNGAVFAILAVILAAFVQVDRTTQIVFLVALLPIIQASLNAVIDMTRLAYNEHFVTGTLILLCQLIVYLVAYLVPAFTQNIVLAALIFSGPLVFGSMAGAVLLLIGRPYLLRGGASHAREIGLTGISFSVADGLLVSSLNIVTVWLGSVSSTVLTAWFASISRIFQMVVSPLVLLMVPLAAYVRSHWSRLAEARRNSVIFGIAIACIACGAAAALLIALVDRYYIAGVLRIDPGIGPGGLLPILLLLGVIAGYKGFSLVAYLVLDEKYLVRGTIAIFATALLIGWASSLVLAPLSAVRLFCVAAAVPQAALFVWTTWQHRAQRPLEEQRG